MFDVALFFFLNKLFPFLEGLIVGANVVLIENIEAAVTSFYVNLGRMYVCSNSI